MGKLNTLLDRCKCGVYLTINQHRDYYQTAEVALIELDSCQCPPQLEPEVRAKMIETNTIINLHFFPDTPIGSYDIYHYDLDAALNEALECLN